MGQPWGLIGSESVEVLSGVKESDYGNSSYIDWSNPTVDAVLSNCSLQPITGSEVVTDREAIITRYQVYVPGFQASLGGTKRLRWRGVVYAIDGSTPYFPDPFGLGLDHHVFYIKEVSG